ncbi:MAG: hypothetical protein ACHQQP_07205 [Gemmatimonadales bacterium]
MHVSAALLVSGMAVMAGAQGTASLAQLDGRASASLRAQITSLADSLTRADLPTAPIVDKTLEGISKGASEQRIMIAVRGVAVDLGIARRALGPSSDYELASAVAALRAGATPDALVALRRSLPGRSLVVPMSVLASLLVDGAPSTSAVKAVVAVAKQRDDSTLLAYGQAVSRDMASGVAPTTAMFSPRGSGVTLSSLDAGRPGTVGSPLPPTPKPKP